MKQLRYLKHVAVAVIMFFGILSVVYAQSQTPGGVNGGNYQFVAWLTPDGYVQSGAGGVWQNNFADGVSVGNFNTETTTRTPTINTTWGYNFHPSILFIKNSIPDASNRLLSANAFNFDGRNFSIFLVMRATPTHTFNGLLSLGTTGDRDLSNITWDKNGNPNINFPGNTKDVVLSALEGLLTFENSSGAAGLYTWLNGTAGAAQGLYRAATNFTHTGKIRISGGGDASYGFEGNIQEIIIVSSGNNGTLMSTTDRQKIHSYLAVKYGITLGTTANVGGGNYVNSAGTVIWDRTVNNGYNNAIFGIGRDNDTRLNQVQSRSISSDMLTLYKGNLNAMNNNSSNELTDKTHVMIGSNGLGIGSNIAYQQPIGTSFENGVSDIKLNFRTPLIYRAQVTTNGVPGGTQTVNIRVNSDRLHYVFVSNNVSFTTGIGGGTYFYPISGRTANINVKDGDYITFGGFEPLPGGIAGYSLDLWVSGDNSSNNSWENLAASAYTLQKFSTHAPIVQNSKFNFHKELFFGNTTSSKLRTNANYTITTGQAYYAFVVSENNAKGESILLSYNPGTSDANARRTSLRWQTKNSIRANWNNTTANTTNTVTGSNNFGIASMNILNTSNTTNTMSLSGTNISTVPSVGQSIGVPLLVGNGNNNNGTGTTLRLNGSIQEIILMRGTARLSASEITRIHTYLAIKYGITLASDDYLASDGSVVWSRSGNAGYTNNIFGLARDNESGLYQKQAKSASSPYLTMFANGSTLKTLNAENTGALEDKQYIIAGSNGGTTVQRINIPIEPNTEYENGTIDGDMLPLNIKTATYKVQLSGFAIDSVRVTMVPQQDYYYAQVSIDENFTPTQTRLYRVVEGKAEVDFANTYKYFRFVGFAPGPGGVMTGLKLWLRADDEAAVTLGAEVAGSGRLASYTAIHGEDPTDIPTVTSWSDLVRGHDFVQSEHEDSRAPVYRPSAPDMNYHPAVFFWYYGTNAQIDNAGGPRRAYLWNSGNIFDEAQPQAHSAIFMVNNQFLPNQNDWVYTMLFSSAGKDIGSGSHYQGPGYGLNRTGLDGGRGRYRARNGSDADGAGVAIGQQNLFKTGSTTILSYYPRVTGSGNYPPVSVLFRYNALEETRTATYNSNTDMKRPSQLGTGFAPDRTINGVMSEVIFYDRELTMSEIIKVETYLALKYGVTLHPSNVATNRFDYTLSDGTVLWKGNTATSDPVYGKFAQYYNRVTAILRDDVARLNNRHSHSTNVGSLLHLGIAGTRLSNTGDASGVGYWEKNTEAVIFGDDGATGVSSNNSTCGEFDYRFNRIWLVRKMTYEDRPISLLVGAQDNRNLSIGEDATTTAYYNELVSTNDVVLVVGLSAADIANGNYSAVVPMSMINGEYQCNYVFKDSDTYITFGYRPNITGCYSPEDAQFPGTKTFKWTQYNNRTNRSNAVGLTISGTNPAGPVDLGDNIVVTNTQLVYPGGLTGVRATRGYPRSSNYPSKGGLEVRRCRGTTGQEVLIKITFNKPVMPSFSISGIDNYCKNSFDEVAISGECSGATHFPLLTAANRTPSYKISGNTATAKGKAHLAGNKINGTVDIAFHGAVENVIIRYRLKNRVSGTQRIFISPITLEATAPPPPINEDGIGFEKYANATDITTCDEVVYTFRLLNTNCDDKYVHFTDELIPNMKWEWETFALDTLNNWYNPSLKVNDYGGKRKLEIDSLLIPGTSDIKLKAIAVFDEDAPSSEYKNIASITYNRYTYLLGSLVGTEEITVYREVPLNVEWQQRQKKLQVEVISRPTYSEDIVYEVTYMITNPNLQITSVFVDFDFNENFYYVNNSFLYYTDDPEALPELSDPVLVTDGDWTNDVTNKTNNYLSLAGDADANTGFTLPTGVSYITFKIKTPVLSLIEDELDENGQLTGNKDPLIISHSFFSTMDDPCLVEAVKGIDGAKIIRYAKRKTHIPTNKNLTGKLKK